MATISTTITNTVTLATTGAYASPLTIAATGAVTATGVAIYGSNAQAWTVDNDGTIAASGGGAAHDAGVYLMGSGTIVNEAGGATSALISGSDGINAYDVNVTNYGTITGTDFFGIIAITGGSITNSGGALISGPDDGVVLLGGAPCAVDNAGTIVGSAEDGIILGDGGTVTNTGAGLISGGEEGVRILSTAGTVGNAGTITASLYTGVYLAYGIVTNSGTITGGTIGPHGAGVYLLGGGTIVNGAGGATGAMISGYRGVDVFSGAGTIVNSGTISGTGIAGIGIQFSNTASTLTNAGLIAGYGGEAVVFGTGNDKLILDPGARFVGTVDGGAGNNTLELASAAGTGTLAGLGVSVVNFGTVTVDAGASWVLSGDTVGSGVTLTDNGTLTNEGTIDTTVTLGSGAVFDNASDGTITVASGPAVKAGSGTATVTNAGTIAGSGFGVSLSSGGSVTNNGASALISGDYGVYATGLAASVTNSGAIAGGRYGVLLNKGGGVVNNTAGTISATNDGVVIQRAAGAVSNYGTISGGIGVDFGGAFNDTLTNAGKIAGTGGTAVQFAGGNDLLVLKPGAAFTGTVDGGAGMNTIELASSASGGTLNGLGATYTEFQTVTIDSGASWDIDGTKAGIDGSTIQGFHAGDRLDITDLGFTAGDSATYSGGVLTIDNAGGTSIASVNLTGSFTGHFFNLLSDGHTGTVVEEDNTACYCRGTLILTTKGEVAVEHLRIGDLLVTRSGAPRPIRWIGTRAYSGRFAAGNKTVLPIRIAAGALADNVPKRNLFVSPLHAMFIDDALIPAIALVNGTSIAQAEAFERIEYFHLELDSHDVIVAEGALAESFIDDDSRAMFHNADEYRRLYPDAARKPADYCAPIVEEGPELETVRQRIAARATSEKMNRAA